MENGPFLAGFQPDRRHHSSPADHRRGSTNSSLPRRSDGHGRSSWAPSRSMIADASRFAASRSGGTSAKRTRSCCSGKSGSSTQIGVAVGMHDGAPAQGDEGPATHDSRARCFRQCRISDGDIGMPRPEPRTTEYRPFALRITASGRLRAAFHAHPDSAEPFREFLHRQGPRQQIPGLILRQNPLHASHDPPSPAGPNAKPSALLFSIRPALRHRLSESPPTAAGDRRRTASRAVAKPRHPCYKRPAATQRRCQRPCPNSIWKPPSSA